MNRISTFHRKRHSLPQISASMDRRINVWDRLMAEKTLEITSPNGIYRYLDASFDHDSGPISPIQLAVNQGSVPNHPVVARLDESKLWDLNRPLESPCQVQILEYVVVFQHFSSLFHSFLLVFKIK